MSRAGMSGAPPSPKRELITRKYKAKFNSLQRGLYCRRCEDDDPQVIEDSRAGNVTCMGCGLILQERVVDRNSEWRTFSENDRDRPDPTRVGASAHALLPNALVTSTTRTNTGDTKALDMRKAQLVAQVDKSAKSNLEERYLLAQFKKIGEACDVMKLDSSVKQTAEHIFKLCNDEASMKGSNTSGVIAACVRTAALMECKVRFLDEITAGLAVSRKVMKKALKRVGAVVKKHRAIFSNKRTTNLESADYVPRFCGFIDVPEPVCIDITEAARNFKQHKERITSKGGSGHKPHVWTAGLIAVGCEMRNVECDLEELGERAFCKPSTINNVVSELQDFKMLLFTKNTQRENMETREREAARLATKAQVAQRVTDERRMQLEARLAEQPEHLGGSMDF